MSEEIKLLPCPFCGELPEYQPRAKGHTDKRGHTYYWPHTLVHNCKIAGHICFRTDTLKIDDTKEALFAAWNTRTTPQPPAKKLCTCRDPNIVRLADCPIHGVGIEQPPVEVKDLEIAERFTRIITATENLTSGAFVRMNIVAAITESAAPLLLEIEELKQANHAANELIGAQAQENDKINQSLLRKIEELVKEKNDLVLKVYPKLDEKDKQIQSLQSQIAAIRTELEDIATTAHCISLSGKLKIEDVWIEFDKISNRCSELIVKSKLTTDGSELGDKQYESSLKFFGWNPQKETADMFLSGLNGKIETLNHKLSTSLELLVKAKGDLAKFTNEYCACTNLTRCEHCMNIANIETFLKENGVTG